MSFAQHLNSVPVYASKFDWVTIARPAWVPVLKMWVQVHYVWIVFIFNFEISILRCECVFFSTTSSRFTCSCRVAGNKERSQLVRYYVNWVIDLCRVSCCNTFLAWVWTLRDLTCAVDFLFPLFPIPCLALPERLQLRFDSLLLGFLICKHFLNSFPAFLHELLKRGQGSLCWLRVFYICVQLNVIKRVANRQRYFTFSLPRS